MASDDAALKQPGMVEPPISARPNMTGNALDITSSTPDARAQTSLPDIPEDTDAAKPGEGFACLPVDSAADISAEADAVGAVAACPGSNLDAADASTCAPHDAPEQCSSSPSGSAQPAGILCGEPASTCSRPLAKTDQAAGHTATAQGLASSKPVSHADAHTKSSAEGQHAADQSVLSAPAAGKSCAEDGQAAGHPMLSQGISDRTPASCEDQQASADSVKENQGANAGIQQPPATASGLQKATAGSAQPPATVAKALHTTTAKVAAAGSKRAPTAYFIFANAHRSSAKQELLNNGHGPKVSVAEVSLR